MKKFISIILVCSLCIGVFVGCGSKNSNGNVKISVGDWPSSEGTRLDNYTNNKTRFETQYPNITVEPDTWTFDISSFYPKASAGTLPSIYSTYLTEMQNIISGGYAADVTDAMEEYGYKDNLSDIMLKLVSDDDKIYAVPMQAYILGIMYNVEMFEKAGLMDSDGNPIYPKTWDELAQTAVKLKEVNGKSGFLFPTAKNNGGWMFTCLAWSYGVDFMENDGGKWKATFDTDEAVSALEYIKDLKWKYNVLPDSSFIDNSEMYKLYATENAAMLMATPSSVSTLSNYEMSKDKIGMFPIPKGPKRHVSLLGGSVKAVSNKSTPEQIDAVFKWMTFDGAGYDINEAGKISLENQYKENDEKGRLIGIDGLKLWKENSPREVFNKEMIDKYHNSNINHVRAYNECLSDPTLEIQPEEPVCCQELYGILDNVIQEVLTNKDTDCKKLIHEANEKFQKNYLDTFEY